MYFREVVTHTNYESQSNDQHGIKIEQGCLLWGYDYSYTGAIHANIISGVRKYTVFIQQQNQKS